MWLFKLPITEKACGLHITMLAALAPIRSIIAEDLLLLIAAVCIAIAPQMLLTDFIPTIRTEYEQNEMEWNPDSLSMMKTITL